MPAAPPTAPEMQRRFAFARKQWIALPLIFAMPVLALFGVFGERHAEAHATSSSLDLQVVYPARFRYRQTRSLDVRVRNISGRRLDTVMVAFDTAYVTRFSSVHFEPAPRIAYIVPLVGVEPGESRLIAVELSGERYGRHRGRITAAAASDTAVARVSTVVFP